MKKNREEGHLRQVHSWNMLGPRSVIFVTVVHACLVWSTSACAAAASTVPVGEIALDSEGHLVLTDSHNTTTLGYVLEQLKQLNSVVAAQSSLIQQQQQLLQPHDCSAVRGLDFPNHITLNAAGTAAVYCDMEHDGGGWTLVAVSSDDGQETWTWPNRTLWTSPDVATLGSIDADAASGVGVQRDYKAAALNTLPFRDVLFVHAPSGVWASYHNVSDGSVSLGTFLQQLSMQCYLNRSGHPLSAGTWQHNRTWDSRFCFNDTALYFNAMDADQDHVCYLGTEQHKIANGAFGPVWNVYHGLEQGVCPWNDPGYAGSLGPCEYGVTEYCATAANGVLANVGFGAALGLNTAPPGSAGNNMRVFVR
eukprot:m.223725 g.223725  ORF g.223725 m.223725 type:complete len:364 (+) comp22325_c2_seq21:58-1149(+)